MIDLEKLRLDDAEITSVVVEGDSLKITYRDWQEKSSALIFEGVIGYQWFSPENRPLSHATVKSDDLFIRLAVTNADEEMSTRFKSYSFVAAWDDAIILQVVATAVQAPG